MFAILRSQVDQNNLAALKAMQDRDAPRLLGYILSYKRVLAKRKRKKVNDETKQGEGGEKVKKKQPKEKHPRLPRQCKRAAY